MERSQEESREGAKDVIVHDIDQRSEAWHQLRLGRVTSSCASDMLATLKSGKGEAAGRRNLRVRLVLERIVGRSCESDFQSAAMRGGHEREADAQALYEALTGRILHTTGFVAHDSLMAGASPDGYVGDWEGLVEAKCPIPATHLDYLKSGQVPGEYLKQVHHQLWITGAQWCDWLSYSPEFPEPIQVKLVRIKRDEAEIAAYELLVRQFLSEVERELEGVQQLMVVPAVA